VIEHLLFLPKVKFFFLFHRATIADVTILVAHDEIHIELPTEFVLPAHVLPRGEIGFDVGDD